MAFAEFEQSLILERSVAERVVACARGRFSGRQEKLTFNAENFGHLKRKVTNITLVSI